MSAAKHILPVPVSEKTNPTVVPLAPSSEIWAIVDQSAPASDVLPEHWSPGGTNLTCAVEVSP